MWAFLVFIPKMMSPQFSLRMFLPSEVYSHIRYNFISLITVYASLHSKESPLFFTKFISHVLKRSLSHLVVSWGNHNFRVSGKVSNLLQHVRSFPYNSASYREEILLTKLKYNPVGLHCCYVRHSNMPHYCFWDLSPSILLSSLYCIGTSSWFITTHGSTNMGVFFSACKALWHFNRNFYK